MDETRLADLEARMERIEVLFGRMLAQLEKFGPLLDRFTSSAKLSFRKKD
jgi:hypothetical protein